MSMTLDEYQTTSKRTMDPEQSTVDLGNNILLGLIGEIGEVAELVKKALFHGKAFAQIELLKECGDVLWYTAAEFTGSGLKMSVIDLPDFTAIDTRVGERPLSDIDCVLGLHQSIEGGDVQSATNRLCMLSRILQNNGSTLAAAASVNVDKLQARYPEGFKKSAAPAGVAGEGSTVSITTPPGGNE